MTATSRKKKLVVGSWPGREFADNEFIRIFCSAIEGAGAEIVDVPDPALVAPKSLDILQIHWAEMVYWGKGSERAAEMRALSVVRALWRLKRSGVKIIWMVHNLKPHNAGGLRRQLVWKLYGTTVAKLVDGVIALSPATLPLILQNLNFSKAVVSTSVRHPAYLVQINTGPDSRVEARSRFGVKRGSPVLSFVGHIRRYKGVERLIEAVKRTPEASLVAAGQCYEPFRSDIEQAAAGAENIDLRVGRLDDDAFEGLIAASDYVVLPFLDSLHSGSIVHALSLGRPVITPRSPFALDLQSIVGRDWLQLYDAPLSHKHIENLPPAPLGAPDLTKLSPAVFGKEITEFYQSIVEKK